MVTLSTGMETVDWHNPDVGETDYDVTMSKQEWKLGHSMTGLIGVATMSAA